MNMEAYRKCELLEFTNVTSVTFYFQLSLLFKIPFTSADGSENQRGKKKSKNDV